MAGNGAEPTTARLAEEASGTIPGTIRSSNDVNGAGIALDPDAAAYSGLWLSPMGSNGPNQVRF